MKLVTSLAVNHVHFINVQNTTAYSAILNIIPAIDVTKYTLAPLADNRSIFSGHRAIDSDNAITKDRRRLERTTQLNATIFLLHSAIIKTHSSYAGVCWGLDD